MSLCSIFHLLRTLLLLPRTHIPYHLPQDYTYGWESDRQCQRFRQGSRSAKIHFTMLCRLSCGRKNAYSVHKLEERTDGFVTTDKEADGKESDLSATDDRTEVQETNKGTDSDRCCWCHYRIELHITTDYFFISDNENHYVPPERWICQCEARAHWKAPPFLRFSVAYVQRGIMETHFQRVQLWVFRVACCPGSSCGTCSGCPLCSWDTTSSLAHSTQCSPGWPTVILTWVTHLSDAWKCNFLLISCQRQSTTFFFSLVHILLTCSVSQYTNAFGMAQLCGVLCAPWNGLIMDRHRGKPLKPGKSIAALTWAHLQCGRLFF